MLYYAFRLQPKEAPTERRIPVYDSFYAPARPFLLTRAVARNATAPVLNGTAPSPPGLNSTSASDAEATNTGNGPDLVQAASFMLRSPGQSGRWQEGEEDTVSLACGMEHAGHADSFAVTSPFMARVCLHVCAQSLSQYPQARAL